MISKQLLNYIEREDKLGKSKKEVENILVSAGWHKDAISDALDAYYGKDKEIKKEESMEENEEIKEGVRSGKFSEKRRLRRQEESESRPQASGKRKVRPVFLIILSFVLGMASMLSVSVLLLDKVLSVDTTTKTTGFEAQKIDDGKRIIEVLAIQGSLEKYYDEHKSYPENLSSLENIPTASSDLNYTYTPIGSPPQSYTLNIEMKNTSNGEFKIEGGFMTLRNKQGTK